MGELFSKKAIGNLQLQTKGWWDAIRSKSPKDTERIETIIEEYQKKVNKE